MDINYLHEFTVIAKLGSFSLAGEELFISQSSLSKHIFALEKEMGVQLFNRTSRSVLLTEAGTQILPYAAQIVETKKKITNIITEQNDRQKQVVKIASIPVMAQYGITGIIARFHNDHPEITISVSEYDSQNILGKLESGECELAFNRESEEKSHSLECIPFYNDYLVAVVPRGHLLSGEEEIRLQQLADEEFVFINKGSLLYDLCFKLCLDAGFTPKIKYTGYWPENIIDFVSKGMGVSLLMKRHTDYYHNPGVSSIKVAPTVTSAICLAKSKKHTLSHAARVFWNYIKLHK